MERHRFTSTTFYIWSGLLLWMANFLFVYVFAAVACARHFTHAQLFGFDLVMLVTTVSSIAAGLGTCAVMWVALRQLRREKTADEHSNFIRFLVLGSGALALVGLAWVALPPLLATSGCE